jgi:hypothetical protein
MPNLVEMDKRAYMETHRRERGCKMPRAEIQDRINAEMNAPSNKTFKDLADEIFNKETLRRARTLRRRAVLAEVRDWMIIIGWFVAVPFAALWFIEGIAVMLGWAP